MAIDITPADQIETIGEQAKNQIPEIEPEAVAREVRAVLRELRENPSKARSESN